jgi:integrase
MKMKKPRYTHGFIDRHGKSRYYFRRPGYKQVPLPGLPWSPQFMAAYEAAMKGETRPVEIGIDRTKPGTVAALAVAYFRSSEFLGLSPSTQATYRGIIERLRVEHGHRRVAHLQRDKLTEMLGNRAKAPAAANNWLRMVRMLMRFAIELGMRNDDPTLGIKTLKIKSDGFKIWEPEQIQNYRAKHAVGTRALLALELLLNTAQRRSDVVRMGRQHVRDGILSIRQKKTGTLVEIPILQELQQALDAIPANNLTFLTTEHSRPFTAAGFGNWFRERCNEAGVLKGYAAHGLRKAAATRLAEAGCTDHQIMAWGGWETLKEVQRYTKAANRKRLAQSVLEKLERGTTNGKP